MLETNIQEFYDDMAEYYHLIFNNWEHSIDYHATVVDRLFMQLGISKESLILDCACGIGTQIIGLARLGYKMFGSDISSNEIARAKTEAINRGLSIDFRVADFRSLDRFFANTFDVVLAIDNALPHLTQNADFVNALRSIYKQTTENGVFIASIRDYDEILKLKPSNSPPSVISTVAGKRIVFQVWDWQEDEYDFTQYIIVDEDNKLNTHKFCSRYKALTRSELTAGLLLAGYRDVKWIFPEESGFYQPVVIAEK